MKKIRERSTSVDLRLLYQDSHILLIGKPAGVPAQPDPSGQADLLSAVQSTYPTASLVHRLDTPTGGVMVFGLTPKATAKLCALVQDHSQFCKEYWAVTANPPEAQTGQLRDYLFHDKQKNKAFVTDGKRKGSKEAVLDYRTVATLDDGHALLLVRLHTGRTHQIRVQLASRGLPLVGDGKYGSREKAPFIGLWAYRLTFLHPITGKNLTACSAPDTDMMPWCLFRDQIHD
jgi:23S rRNA pseudouridine1911/1915/1917 synthase